MKYLFSLSLLFLCHTMAFATDHWVVLVNGQRVFECISTCSAHGVNPDLLKASVSLKAGDKVTVIYTKDTLESKITKNIMITDSALKQFQTFSVYDADGDHAITVKADDFISLHKVVLWYSETRKINSKDIVTEKVALVYFE